MDQIERQEISKDIERYLFNSNVWISADFISSMWDIPQRSLRGEDGLLRSFAISGESGYRHIEHASDEEFHQYCARIKKHAVEELRKVQHLKRRRKGDKVQELNLSCQQA